MALEPEKRAELLALRAKLQPFRDHLRQVGEYLETRIVQEESLWLAVEERVGREARDGDPILPEDDERAAKIVADCWGPV